MKILTTTTGTLTVQQISDQDGFTQVGMKTQEIVALTDIVVHIIHLEEIDKIL